MTRCTVKKSALLTLHMMVISLIRTEQSRWCRIVISYWWVTKSSQATALIPRIERHGGNQGQTLGRRLLLPAMEVMVARVSTQTDWTGSMIRWLRTMWIVWRRRSKTCSAHMCEGPEHDLNPLDSRYQSHLKEEIFIYS